MHCNIRHFIYSICLVSLVNLKSNVPRAWSFIQFYICLYIYFYRFNTPPPPPTLTIQPPDSSSNEKHGYIFKAQNKKEKERESNAKHSLKLTSHNHVNCRRALACLHWCAVQNFDICSQLICEKKKNNHRNAVINGKQASKHTSVCLSICL